jgi:hypothetical protein
MPFLVLLFAYCISSSEDCEISSYRHGCDPPKTSHASPGFPHDSGKAIPHSINRVKAIPLGISLSISEKEAGTLLMNVSFQDAENSPKTVNGLLGGIPLDRPAY